jgi:3-hydroxyacyl-CoA dehydrogenase
MSPHIDRVAVVGCGLIGSGWASWFLAKGLEVTCTDPARGAEARLKNSVSASLAELGHSQADCQQILARLHFEPDIVHAVSAADWIQENTPEDLSVKREILARIDQACRPDAVIASSTSSLKVSDMQVRLSHPERLVAGHPFLPVTLIPLVEVAGGAETAEAVIDAAMAFYRSVDKRPVRLRKEITGHIANRLQAAVMREAFFLLTFAEIETIVIELSGRYGTRFEFECYDVSHLYNLAYFAEQRIVEPPFFIQCTDRTDISFKTSDGLTLRGWHYRPQGVSGTAPMVVTAYGFGGVKEMALDSFAQVFAAALGGAAVDV